MLRGFLRLALASTIMGGAALTTAQAQSPLTAGASWVNELGSVLTITSVAANGLMTGTYTTATGCDAHIAQPMTGWYYGNSSGSGGAISFSVFWAGCNSVTSWSGQYDTSNGHFKALWYLTLAAMPAWNGIYAGADSFVPQNNAMKK